MKRDFDSLSGEVFDLIIIGGGINGAGIARDASLRGLKTLLLEKDDFGHGTTARSSRLIHGGLRYLRHFKFGLVRQDMREREILLRIAPHLVHPLPFLIPVTGKINRLVMMAGMRLYDLLSYDKSVPSVRYFSRAATLEMEPGLEIDGMTGSYLYYDCQVPFAERLCLENVLAAVENGAAALNHARATGLVKDGDAVTGVDLEDTLTGEKYRASGKLVVNAAGHWADDVFGLLGGSRRPLLRRSKGIHLVTRRLTKQALVLFARTDGRLFFVIPWEGCSLVGTTDTDYSGDPDDIKAGYDDVAYLMREAQRVFPGLVMEDIYYSMAGLRSLGVSHGRNPSNVSRSHQLYDHRKRDGLGGLVTLLGGKLTGYRGIAEETVDLVCRKMGVKTACRTAEIPLPGAPENETEKLVQDAREAGLSAETAAHLTALYGGHIDKILDKVKSDSRGGGVLCPHSNEIIAQIWHAVESEGAVTVGDYLLRRGSAGLASCQGLDAVETVAAEMGGLLGWNDDERKRQVEAYRLAAASELDFKS